MSSNSVSSLVDKYSEGKTKVRSKYLDEIYELQEANKEKRFQVDPRDIDGARLSHFWEVKSQLN